MASFLTRLPALSGTARGKSARRIVRPVLPEALEARLLMTADWTGPNPTQVTAYDLGTIQGNVDPAPLSIDQPSDVDWFKFTLGGPGGALSIGLFDSSGHTQVHIIAPSGSTLDLADNHTLLDSAPVGSVYYIEITGVSGQISPSYTFTISAQGTGTSTPGPGDPRPIQTQRAAFITQLFQDTLHRDPDNTGIDSWVNGLTSGAITPSEVASDIINSTEFRTNTIRGLYQSILGRQADQAGLDSWLGFFASGGTVEQMKAQFYGSDEFYNSVGGSNAALVDAFYVGFLNRHAEPDGLAVWTGQLDQGVPRSTVAIRIENLSLEGAQGIVTNAYVEFLRRQPDALYAHWIAQVQAGISVLDLDISLLGSQEYYNNASAGVYGT